MSNFRFCPINHNLNFTKARAPLVGLNRFYSPSSSRSLRPRDGTDENEAIHKALEADNRRQASSHKEGILATEKRMLIGFTCKKCDHRTHRTMSHHAYHNGIVLIECEGCQSRHLIADNLGWFKDTPNAAKKIEEMTEDVGEIRRTLKLNENKSKGLIELLK